METTSLKKTTFVKSKEVENAQTPQLPTKWVVVGESLKQAQEKVPQHQRASQNGRRPQLLAQSYGTNSYVTLTCHYCGIEGHFRPNCFKYIKLYRKESMIEKNMLRRATMHAPRKFRANEPMAPRNDHVAHRMNRNDEYYCYVAQVALKANASNTWLSVMFGKVDCSILKENGQVLLKGRRSSDSCYCLESNLVSCNLSTSKQIKLEAFPSFEKKVKGICGSCQQRKQTKSVHKKGKILSTKEPLELLHMDLMGPIQTESLGGRRYILVVVYDFSRFTWTYFLREKSKAFEKFKMLCVKIQNEKTSHIKSIKKIKSDHGKEFENASFENFCNSLCISHDFSAPKTPQQNGVVERKNRVLQEMAIMMLLSNKVSRNLWAEAINMACYIGNRVFLRLRTKQTSYELWKGKKPNVSYFHIFGSKCYIHNDRDQLGKFDAMSDEGIFLGYALNSKAYRVFNLKTRSVMESSNVVFDGFRPKHDNYEEDVCEIDDLPLKESGETSSGVKSNQDEDDDLPLNKVPNLDYNEPAP
ncbi:hypothetical protein QYF36_007816 [Acer negundo]|nr:hypothetical protein QYF36_007816 [Acer negundo]